MMPDGENRVSYQVAFKEVTRPLRRRAPEAYMKYVEEADDVANSVQSPLEADKVRI